MIHIPLTEDRYALIDNEDLELILGYKWRLEKNRNDIYAIATLKDKNRSIRMHRLIMKAQKGDQIDHINHNGLDNRKTNLRIVTTSQNQMNRLKRHGTTSKYKGVSWNKNGHKWEARVVINKKDTYIGLFDSEIEAAQTYDKWAKDSFGEYARLNLC